MRKFRERTNQVLKKDYKKDLNRKILMFRVNKPRELTSKKEPMMRLEEQLRQK